MLLIHPMLELMDVNRLLDQPRRLGLVCAAVALGLGIVYLTAAGAPLRYPVINFAAFVVGFAIWMGIGSLAKSEWKGGLAALTAALLATALFAPEVNGASRWVSIGPLSLQVSLIVLPAIIVLYARSTNAIGTACALISALALAAQPDRAMAAVLLAGTAVIFLVRRSRLSALALAGAVAGFVATMLLPDTVPAVPFVERVLYTAFDVHILVGFVVWVGCFILLMPTLGAARRGSDRPELLAFGASWAAVIAAAALGNYPTPILGYGGSSVLGYLLSVGLLAGSHKMGIAVQGDAPVPSGQSS